MVSCLILDHKMVNKNTMKIVLHALLEHKDYDILRETNERCIVFIWNVMKCDIWQIALYLEFSSIHVGYGFGQCKREAKERAQTILTKRNNLMCKNKVTSHR